MLATIFLFVPVLTSSKVGFDLKINQNNKKLTYQRVKSLAVQDISSSGTLWTSTPPGPFKSSSCFLLKFPQAPHTFPARSDLTVTTTSPSWVSTIWTWAECRIIMLPLTSNVTDSVTLEGIWVGSPFTWDTNRRTHRLNKDKRKQYREIDSSPRAWVKDKVAGFHW